MVVFMFLIVLIQKKPNILLHLKRKQFLYYRHTEPIWQIAWAHPRFGSMLASCSYDHNICIWKEQKPNEWERIKGLMHHNASGVLCLKTSKLLRMGTLGIWANIGCRQC